MILALSVHTAHRLQEVGLLIAGLGAVVLLIVGVMGYRRIEGLSTSPATPEWTMVAVAGVLLGIGFLIQIIGVHG